MAYGFFLVEKNTEGELKERLRERIEEEGRIKLKQIGIPHNQAGKKKGKPAAEHDS